MLRRWTLLIATALFLGGLGCDGDILFKLFPKQGTSASRKPIYDLLVATKRRTEAGKNFRIGLHYPMKPKQGTRAVNAKITLVSKPPDTVKATETTGVGFALEGRIATKGKYRFDLDLVHPETGERRREVFELEVY